MDSDKKEGKRDSAIKSDKNNDSGLGDKGFSLDGKRLYDLYRHTTKLIE